MECESVCLWHVHGHELDPAFHQVRDEGDRPGQPVQLGDHQNRPFLPADGKCCGQLGPVVVATALHLHELAQEVPAGGIGRHGGPLRIEAEAALPLPFGRNAVIGDEGRNQALQGQVL